MKAALELAKTMEASCLGVRSTRFQRLISRHFTEALRPCGMTIPQMEVLAMLVLAGGPTKPTALADSMAIERSTMSRSLALMETAGWVKPEVSATGRTMAIAITPAGEKQLLSGRSAWTQAQTEMVAILGPEAAKLLDCFLGALVTAAASS